MLRTAWIQPRVTPRRWRAVAALVTAYADASTRPVPHVREHQIWIGPHGRTYRTLRAQTPLDSQMADNVIFSARKACKARKTRRRIHRDVPVHALGFTRAGMDKKRTDFSVVQAVIAPCRWDDPGTLPRKPSGDATPQTKKPPRPRLFAVDGGNARSPAHYGLAKKGANT